MSTEDLQVHQQQDPASNTLQPRGSLGDGLDNLWQNAKGAIIRGVSLPSLLESLTHPLEDDCVNGIGDNLTQVESERTWTGNGYNWSTWHLVEVYVYVEAFYSLFSV